MKKGDVAQILMVDDDVALLRVVREAFTTCLRCEVDTSPKPEYGFELTLKKRYDLFIFGRLEHIGDQVSERCRFISAKSARGNRR